MKDLKLHLSPESLIILFFSGYFVFGLLLVDDYGIHWDDHSQYIHGLVSTDYINELSGGWFAADKPYSDIRLEDYKDRSHGVVFQMAALSIQHLLGISDPRGIFLLRHYFTFLLFFTGLIFFFRLLMLRFENRAMAILGVLFMVLSPRIFADSFYNSKDIVFLSLFIISIWTLIRFLQKATFASASFHALASALLISTRIVGVFLPVVTLLFLFLKPFILKNEIVTGLKVNAAGILASLRVVLIKGGIYLFLMFLLTFAFWPYLWSDPFRRLIEVFTTMSNFNWDDPVLFLGKYYLPSNLPLYYIPFWILISTPVLYSVLFFLGLGFFVTRSERGLCFLFDSLCIVLFFLPLLSVIVHGSVIYDGWRHLFFLYVPFMILSLVGFHEIMNFIKKKLRPISARLFKWSLFLIILISSVGTASFMIRYHPHQNVYFNFLAGKNTTKNFEADYWGLSQRQVLQYLLDNDPSDTIKILSANWSGKANADIFPREQRDRLRFVSPGEASYFISNYRFPPEHDKFINLEYPYNRPVIEIKVNGNKISGAYHWNQ